MGAASIFDKKPKIVNEKSMNCGDARHFQERVNF
jgi:hypothetical protein